jgi:hypothetical protein
VQVSKFWDRIVVDTVEEWGNSCRKISSSGYRSCFSVAAILQRKTLEYKSLIVGRREQ